MIPIKFLIIFLLIFITVIGKRNKKDEVIDRVRFKINEPIRQIESEEQMLAPAATKSKKTGRYLSFDEIHTYEVVDEYLVELGQDYPDTVTTVSGGSSFEGRDIKYLKISTTNFQDETKPVIMLVSLLNAREWISLPVTLYAIRKLVIDISEQNLVEDIDWIILPIANPDGYVFSHTTDRLWTKNRATGYFTGDTCVGVNLNRNFDIFWGTGSSNLVCSEEFYGRGPFSEPESSVIRDIINGYSSRLAMYMDFHSFGSKILYAFGNGSFPANADTLEEDGLNMARAIDNVKMDYNANYTVGNLLQLVYYISGTSSDYATAMGIFYSYTYDLPGYRNTSEAGYLVDPDFIEQAGYETWEGIKVGAIIAQNNFK